jgi:regulator of protease activity HflC (stomatin/prohibitin superfamily)
MLGIGYFKGLPTEHVIRYSGGKVRGEGRGLAFFYLRHSTQVVAVPTSSLDASFVFNEATRNFQSVTIQGQATYRIHEPRRTAELLNFTINPETRAYVTSDAERLSQRITNVLQMATRASIEGRSLEDVLGSYEAIAAEVFERSRSSPVLETLGVELMAVVFVAAKPTPEVGKALEAPYREQLLRKADEATFARRAAAVEEERKIKENELNTDIALEQQRRALVDLQAENALREAESRGRAAEAEAEYQARARAGELAVYRGFDPRALLALALDQIGRNAERVGNLTITSEVLASLLNTAAPETDGR